jgi:hypothetical protein
VYNVEINEKNDQYYLVLRTYAEVNKDIFLGFGKGFENQI